MVSNQGPGRAGRSPIHELSFQADRLLDELSGRFRGPHERITVLPFMAHGSRKTVIARGRVLANPPITAARGSEPLVRRVRRMAARFITDELSGVDVEVVLGVASARATSDAEGYFEARLEDPHLPRDRQFHDLTVTVPDPGDAEVHVAPSRAHVVTDRARRLIVSDIDDTVLLTGATRRLQMMVTTAMGSAWTRRSFPGVAELYAGLERGPLSEDENPFCYVSSSPWNLYDFIQAFIERTALPTGPAFLRDLGVDEGTFLSGGHETHKRAAIEELLSLHDLPLVLIGDTGQQDPEIYRNVALDHPDRVEAVLLRHEGDEGRGADVAAMAPDGTPWGVGSDSVQLARHAESIGLVGPGWWRRVAAVE